MPLPWPFVQFALNFFKELLRDVREVRALGDILTDESVGVFVGSTLLVPTTTMTQMLVQFAAVGLVPPDILIWSCAIPS